MVAVSREVLVRASGVPVRLLAVAACVLAADLIAAAQRGGGGAAASQPLVPVTASSLAAHPADYVGRTVTMMGTVAAQLSPTAFTLDQGQATPLPVAILVTAPALTEAPASHAYVSVVGAAVLFDPASLRALRFLLLKSWHSFIAGPAIRLFLFG